MGEKPESLSDRLHLFQQQGYSYALDGNDLSSYRLDEATWHVLRAVQRSCAHEPPVSDADVSTAMDDLRSTGLLTTRSPIEPSPTPSPPPGLCLSAVDFHVTNDCNLRCKYCYGLSDTVRYVHDASAMTAETARAAIDFLVVHTDRRRGLGLIFFGGEPLLNFDVVQETVHYAKLAFKEAEKPIHFSMTTNGTLLTDAVIAFLNEHRVSIMISLDGPPESHDVLRPTRSGGSSYAAMLPGLRRLLESRKGNVTSRATVCSANRDMVALLDHSQKLGFRRTVMCPESSVLNHPFKLDPKSYEREYERLADYVTGTFVTHDPNVPTPFDQLLPMLLFRRAKYRPCGLARDYLAISPGGDLYPCHRFMGDPAFRLGSIRHGLEQGCRDAFVSLPRSCDSCWARMICAGGCRHQHYAATGILGRVAPRECKLVRHLIEVTVHMCFELEDRAETCLSEWVDGLKTVVQRSQPTPEVQEMHAAPHSSGGSRSEFTTREKGGESI